MENGKTERYFLGANSARGFYSLYDGFTDPEGGDFLWVLKGGPGCGKSTFMRRIGAAAEQAGRRVEYIHCSGDPDSLDAVWLPELRLGYADGTAPHVLEPRYPGASGLYLDLGSFLDAGAMQGELDAAADLNRRYKAHYADAYRLLAAAAALRVKGQPGLVTDGERGRAREKAARFAARELPKGGGAGRLRERFVSALSCRGRVSLLITEGLRLVALDDRFGLGGEFLAELAGCAAQRGLDAVVCRDPLEPERIEALLLPERALAVVAEERPGARKADRRLHLDAIPDSARLAPQRPALRARARESEALLARACASLAAAKALHDELEALYRPHVDFAGLDALTEDHIRWFVG